MQPTPTPDQLNALFEALQNPVYTVVDIAAHMDLSIPEVAAILATPEAKAILEAIEQIAETRCRLEQAEARPAAIAALRDLTYSNTHPETTRKAATKLLAPHSKTTTAKPTKAGPRQSTPTRTTTQNPGSESATYSASKSASHPTSYSVSRLVRGFVFLSSDLRSRARPASSTDRPADRSHNRRADLKPKDLHHTNRAQHSKHRSDDRSNNDPRHPSSVPEHARHRHTHPRR